MSLMCGLFLEEGIGTGYRKREAVRKRDTDSSNKILLLPISVCPVVTFSSGHGRVVQTPGRCHRSQCCCGGTMGHPRRVCCAVQRPTYEQPQKRETGCADDPWITVIFSSGHRQPAADLQIFLYAIGIPPISKSVFYLPVFQPLSYMLWALLIVICNRGTTVLRPVSHGGNTRISATIDNSSIKAGLLHWSSGPAIESRGCRFYRSGGVCY